VIRIFTAPEPEEGRYGVALTEDGIVLGGEFDLPEEQAALRDGWYSDDWEPIEPPVVDTSPLETERSSAQKAFCSTGEGGSVDGLDNDLDKFLEACEQRSCVHMDTEGGTLRGAAQRAWHENWWQSYPVSGRGEFVYQRHEGQGKSHGDLRLSVDGPDRVFLAGVSVFATNHDGIFKDDAPILAAFKLPQPVGWIDIGKQSPAQVGEDMFTVVDHGTYEIGVWRQNSIEVFLKGRKMTGRFIIKSVPFEGRKVWVIVRPADQTPFAKKHSLEEEVRDQKMKGHQYVVWAEPGTGPKLIDVRRYGA
jgi:hypothetical protein